MWLLETGKSKLEIRKSKFETRKSTGKDFRISISQFRLSNGLTPLRTLGMVFRIGTTLIIPDSVLRDEKRHAAKRGTAMSELATELLRKGLAERPKPHRLPPLLSG
jgi:chromosome condensin MukBEF MukE localization factor